MPGVPAYARMAQADMLSSLRRSGRYRLCRQPGQTGTLTMTLQERTRVKQICICLKDMPATVTVGLQNTAGKYEAGLPG